MRNNIVGKRVKEARLRMEPPLTQNELAVRLQLENWKISRGGIAKIESGIRRVLDIEVVKLAKVLGVSASWLLGENEQ